MIATSSHNNWNTNLYTTYATSGNRGTDAGYTGKYFSTLAPKKSFWKIWHDNIGKVDEEENIKYYIEEYYKQVLAELEPEEIYKKLDDSVLLCYEDTGFCHRHIVAEWFQILLDVKVPELKIEDDLIYEVERPSYIRTYLEDAIRKNKNMRVFTSLRALYLFEQGEQLEQKACENELKTGETDFENRQIACYLRCEADEEEAKFKEKILTKKYQI